MFGKLLKLMLLLNVFLRCVSETKTSKFMRVLDVIQMPYVEMSSRSVKGRFECLGLCSDDCWFLKYEESGSGLGTCDLYNLRDTYYSSLKFVNISNLYKKVYPPDNAFVGVVERKTWNGARDFCQSLGGNLAIANSTAKVDRMVNLNMGTDGSWVGGQKNGTIWTWLSGAVVTPTPFANDGAACLTLYAGRMDDWMCSGSTQSFCEYQL